METKVIQRLNELSLKYLGSASRWQKMLYKGVSVELNEKELVEGEFDYVMSKGNKWHKKSFHVPVMKKRYFSVDDIAKMLEDQERAFLESVKVQEENETISKIHSDATGTTEKFSFSEPVV